MSEAALAPPRKPRGPRRWPWVVVVLLGFAAYVAGYGVLRNTDHIYMSPVFGSIRRYATNPRMKTIKWPFVINGDNRLTLLFRPCIAVEEWWLNR